MKKIYFSIFTGLGVSLLYAATTYAACTPATLTGTAAGNSAVCVGASTLTASAAAGGGKLSMQLSPGVQVGLFSAQTGYALKSMNGSVDQTTGNRNTYGIAFDYSGYYQQPTTTADKDSIVAPTNTAAATAFSGWTAMGS